MFLSPSFTHKKIKGWRGGAAQEENEDIWEAEVEGKKEKAERQIHYVKTIVRDL